MNRSICHTDCLRRISTGEAASGGTGGAGAATGSEATGGGRTVDSGDSQASSSDATNGYSSCDSEHGSEDYHRRRSPHGTRRSHFPARRHHRKEYVGTSSFLNSVIVRALNNFIADHLAKCETEQVQSLLSSVSALHTSPPVGTPVASRTMQAAFGMTRYQSLTPAPTVTTRMNPNDFEAPTKFSGTDGDQNIIVDRMDPYEAVLKVSLKSRVGMTETVIDASLM